MLSPGTYAVVPSYTGCIDEERYAAGAKPVEDKHIPGAPIPNYGDERKLRHGSAGDISSSSFPKGVILALGELFDGLDADCDGVLCREEVRALVVCHRRSFEP